MERLNKKLSLLFQGKDIVPPHVTDREDWLVKSIIDDVNLASDEIMTKISDNKPTLKTSTTLNNRPKRKIEETNIRRTPSPLQTTFDTNKKRIVDPGTSVYKNPNTIRNDISKLSLLKKKNTDIGSYFTSPPEIKRSSTTESRDNPFDMDIKIVGSKIPPPVQSAKINANDPPIPQLNLPSRHMLSKRAILDSHYTVSKEGLKEEQFDNHRKWLTVEPKRKDYGGKKKKNKYPSKKQKKSKDDSDTDDEEEITTAMKLYSETKNSFTVPRFYGLARWGMVESNNLRTTKGTPIKVTFQGTLTDKQGKAIADMMKHITSNSTGRGGIFKCPCGFGKTVCAMSIISRLGVKCLMTIHKEKLMFALKKEAERWLPGVKVGIIQSNTTQIEGYDICIAMIQSILSRDYPIEMFKDFGVWIPDEAHHISAPSFSLIRRKIRTDKIVALSATPHKGKFPIHVLNWYLGPIVVNIKRTWELVLVTMVRYTKGNQKEEFCKNGDINNGRMITRLAEQDHNRNYMICRDIATCILKPDPLPRRRKCLVLGDRLKQLDQLRDLLLTYFTTVYLKEGTVEKDDTIVNKTRLLLRRDPLSSKVEEIFSIGYRVGGLSEEETDNAATCDVILATYPEAEEGVNVPRIDTVFLVTPRSDVEQSVGRGLRSHPEKNIPHFYYYADAFSLFEKQGWKVRNYFQKEGYNITWRDD